MRALKRLRIPAETSENLFNPLHDRHHCTIQLNKNELDKQQDQHLRRTETS